MARSVALATTGPGTQACPIVVDDDSGDESLPPSVKPPSAPRIQIPAKPPHPPSKLHSEPPKGPRSQKKLKADPAVKSGFGYNLLLSMGFQPGKGLGKHLEGDPINLADQGSSETVGLGHKQPVASVARKKAGKGKVKIKQKPATLQRKMAQSNIGIAPLSSPQPRFAKSSLSQPKAGPSTRQAQVHTPGNSTGTMSQFQGDQDSAGLYHHHDGEYYGAPQFVGPMGSGPGILPFSNPLFPFANPAFFFNQMAFAESAHNMLSMSFPSVPVGNAQTPLHSGSSANLEPSLLPRKPPPLQPAVINGIQYRDGQIGEITGPAAKFQRRGFFLNPTGELPLPARTLVLDDLPRTYRSEDFVRRWLGQFKSMPAVIRFELRDAKVLIEFADAASKEHAFLSRRMYSTDGLAGVRAWHYRLPTNADSAAQTSNTQAEHPPVTNQEPPTATSEDGRSQPPPQVVELFSATDSISTELQAAQVIVPPASSSSSPAQTLNSLISESSARASPPRTHSHSNGESTILTPTITAPPLSVSSVLSASPPMTPVSHGASIPQGKKRRFEETFEAGSHTSATPSPPPASTLDADLFIAETLRDAKRTKVAATSTPDQPFASPHERIDILIAEFNRVHTGYAKSGDKASKQALLKRMVEIDAELALCRTLLSANSTSTSPAKRTSTPPSQGSPLQPIYRFEWPSNPENEAFIIELDDDESDIDDYA